ncbi:MAG: cytochrome c550 [Alphaproteobacteria bacterium]|nr:MAG: cytochrome c550 [Alphaproteobacteria bacterium]
MRPKPLAAQPGSAIWHVRRDSLAMISLIVIAAIALLAIAAPLVAPYPDQGMGVTYIEQKLQAPSWQFLLGTDSLGRDILSRVLFGARTALIAGIAIVAIGSVAGTILGAAAGYFGGWIDEVIMRVTDVFLAFPPLLLAMTVAVVLEPSLTNAIIAISLTWWPWYTRIARGQAVSIRERKYVKAARGIGVGHATVIRRHILPNILTPISVQAMLDLGAAILTVTALSFVGLGVPQPTADWGSMISEGRIYVQTGHWWVPTFPGLALFLTIMAANLLGDAVQAATNPRTRRVAN